MLLPDIRAIEHTANGVSLTFQVPVDLIYFIGHFPDVPLLPGVVQTGWAIELARRYFNQPDASLGRFHQLSAVKFTRVIQPGSTVKLALTFDATTRRLDFEYLTDAGRCSSGTAMFVPESTVAESA